MADLDTREWLLTNGLGSFASGTVCDVKSRTYHGWLIAATDPPGRRTLLLSHIEASLELAGQVVALGTNFWSGGTIEPTGYQFLRSFQINPVPKWIWGENDWQLTRELVMPYGLAEAGEDNAQFCDRVFIKYTYQGKNPAILRLRLLIADRDFHHQQIGIPDLKFSQLLAPNQVCLQAIHTDKAGTPWQLRWTRGDYQPDGVWYWNYCLPEETKRGLGDKEDLYSPGYLTIPLQPTDAVTLEAQVGFPSLSLSPLTSNTFTEAVAAEQQRLGGIFNLTDREELPVTSAQIKQQLLRAGDQFIVYRASISGPTVIAGYHWFNDWGRDTLIALPGLTLSTQRFDLAKGLLETFGRYCRYGLIPNAFPDAGSEPFYNSIDAALWWIEILGLYLEATQDWEFLAQQYPIVQQIYKAFVTGTRFNIQVDATDGLVGWDTPGMALTWMDAIVDGQPVTPRRGKPVEINALWYSALCWASKWAERLSQQSDSDTVRFGNQARRYAQQAEQVKVSLQKFWNPQLNYFYDTIEPDDRPISQVRPNAVLALSLYHCGFSTEQGRKVLAQAQSLLLTPYGLRSLAPTDSEYIGKYGGDQHHRDRAYHQGTVWSWLIGPFIASWKRFYPTEPVPFDWQLLLEHFTSCACIGSISEIFDGDAPHLPQGAIAQAWSVAEAIRYFDPTRSN